MQGFRKVELLGPKHKCKKSFLCIGWVAVPPFATIVPCNYIVCYLPNVVDGRI